MLTPNPQFPDILSSIGTIPPTSVLAKNVAFLEAHPDELQALGAAGIDESYVDKRLIGCCPSPENVEQMPQGFWRTP